MWVQLNTQKALSKCFHLDYISINNAEPSSGGPTKEGGGGGEEERGGAMVRQRLGKLPNRCTTMPTPPPSDLIF